MTEKYFSTKYTVIILGARYIPSVCYKLDEVIEPTIRSLASKGEARLYAEKVRFVNGIPIPVERELGQVNEDVLPSMNVQTGVITGQKPTAKPSGRGKKRDFE